jgi:hypothetical protein
MLTLGGTYICNSRPLWKVVVNEYIFWANKWYQEPYPFPPLYLPRAHPSPKT